MRNSENIQQFVVWLTIVKKVKVKFSHTRCYQALGPKLMWCTDSQRAGDFKSSTRW